MKRAYGFIILSAAGVACFSVVDVIYFQTVGYSLAFIGVMTAAFNLAVTVAELPFAILFDRYSNKLALQIGNLIRIAAFALFFLNLNATTLIAAQILAGIAVAASSGTSNALVLNTVGPGDATRMTHIFGRVTYLIAAATIVGGLVGAIVFHLQPALIWAAAIAFYLAAMVVIATFKDATAQIEKIPWRVYARKSLAVLRGRTAFLYVIANASAVAPFILWQLKFNTVSIAFVFLGFFGMNAISLLGPFVIRWLRIEYRHLAVVAVVNAAVAAVFAFAEMPALILGSFIVHVLLQLVLVILVAGMFHAGIENDVRATSASIISMADSLIVAIIAPGVALVGQYFGIEWAILISCVLYVLIAAVAGFKGAKAPLKETVHD